VVRSQKQLRVGVIGCGSISQVAHFPSLAGLPDTRLVSVCDTDEARAESAAMTWGVKGHHYTNYHHMLESETMDVVIIASPQAFHHEQALAAADTGVHLFVEKPLACTNKEAWEIVAAAERADVRLMVGCNQRFWLEHEMGKELIEEGVIGEAKMGRSSLHEGWHLYPERVAITDFRRRAEQAASAALLEVAVHRVDLLRWLMGSEVTRVIGIAKRIATSSDYTTLDDAAWVLLDFENGATGAISSDRFSPVVSNITEIYGTKGTMFLSSEAHNPFQSVPLAVYTSRDYSWQDLPDTLRKWRYPENFWPDDVLAETLPKRWMTVHPPREWSYVRMIKYFLECIREGKEPTLTSGRDGAKVIEIIMAVFKSMETGQWVDLPLTEEVVPPEYKAFRENR